MYHFSPRSQCVPTSCADESLSSEDDRMHSTSLSPGMDSWDPIKNHFFNPASDFQRVLQSDREQVVQICWNFNSRRGCRFGDRCKFLHSSLRLFSERKTCKSGSHDVHMTPPLPKPKSWVVVEVITVVNPCLFYVHFPAGPASLLTPSTTPEGQPLGVHMMNCLLQFMYHILYVCAAVHEMYP